MDSCPLQGTALALQVQLSAGVGGHLQAAATAHRAHAGTGCPTFAPGAEQSLPATGPQHATVSRYRVSQLGQPGPQLADALVHPPEASGKAVESQGKAVKRQWKAVEGQGKAVKRRWKVKERR